MSYQDISYMDKRMWILKDCTHEHLSAAATASALLEVFPQELET